MDLTLTFRKDYQDDYRSEIINRSYVISIDGMGNPILINEKGELLIFYHDDDSYKILASSLSLFAKGVINGDFKDEF